VAYSSLLLTHTSVLDTHDPSLLASTLAPATSYSNTLLQSDDALHCMAGLPNWAVADCCLLSFLMDGCRFKGHHQPHWLVLSSIKSTPANRRCLLQRQPKSIVAVTGNTSRRLNQINSHGINRHQHRHSWAFVFVAGNTSLLRHQIDHRHKATGSLVSTFCCFGSFNIILLVLLVRSFVQFTSTAAASCCCLCS
jgi:hypothetical protein